MVFVCQGLSLRTGGSVEVHGWDLEGADRYPGPCYCDTRCSILTTIENHILHVILSYLQFYISNCISSSRYYLYFIMCSNIRHVKSVIY